MNKKLKALIGVLILLFFFLIFRANNDSYANIVQTLGELSFKENTSLLYSNLGLYNPLIIIGVALKFDMSIYIPIISSLSFVFIIIFIYLKFIVKLEKPKEKILLLSFIVFSSSFLYRSYSLLFIPYIILAFHFLEDLVYRKKMLPMIITLTLLMFTNWMFAIATLMALMVALIYYIEDDYAYGIKDILRLLACFMIAFGVSSVLLIPSIAEGTLLPESFFPASYAVFLIQLIIAVKHLRQKRHILSTIVGLIFSILLLNLKSALVVTMIPYVFILFKDFLKEIKIENVEALLFVIFFITFFSLSFEAKLIYPLINVYYNPAAINLNKFYLIAKNISFISLTALIIIAYIESKSIKRLNQSLYKEP